MAKAKPGKSSKPKKRKENPSSTIVLPRRADDPPISSALRAVQRPRDDAEQKFKTAYATTLAREMAKDVAAAFQKMGVDDVRPDPSSGRGGERRMAGGFGAKRVDVSFVTEAAGLVFAVSVKGIWFRDSKSKNFRKNLVNRKGDMLAEAATLHKRFPFAVVGGLLFLDEDAKNDGSVTFDGVPSTYERAFPTFRPYTGRLSHADAEEKFDIFAIGLASANSTSYQLFRADDPKTPIQIEDFCKLVLTKVAEVNSDHFYFDGAKLNRVGVRRKKRAADSERETGEEDEEEEPDETHQT